MIGNNGDNHLIGNNGDNVLEGRGGHDTLIGNGGLDTAVFRGSRSQYRIEVFENHVIVSDITVSRDGVNILVGVERLKFEDHELKSSDL